MLILIPWSLAQEGFWRGFQAAGSLLPIGLLRFWLTLCHNTWTPPKTKSLRQVTRELSLTSTWQLLWLECTGVEVAEDLKHISNTSLQFLYILWWIYESCEKGLSVSAKAFFSEMAKDIRFWLKIWRWCRQRCIVSVSDYIKKHACQEREEGHGNPKHIDFSYSHLFPWYQGLAHPVNLSDNFMLQLMSGYLLAKLLDLFRSALSLGARSRWRWARAENRQQKHHFPLSIGRACSGSGEATVPRTASTIRPRGLQQIL